MKKGYLGLIFVPALAFGLVACDAEQTVSQNEAPETTADTGEREDPGVASVDLSADREEREQETVVATPRSGEDAEQQQAQAPRQPAGGTEQQQGAQSDAFGGQDSTGQSAPPQQSPQG